VTNFQPNPNNRWTSYESNSQSDWLEIDFGKEIEFRRVELAIYDDHGGVQAPASYVVQYWTGREWHNVRNSKFTPEQPVGDQWNSVSFEPAKSTRIRVVFTHKGQAKSGVTEIMVFND
jgi:hypothetical protein